MKKPLYDIKPKYELKENKFYLWAENSVNYLESSLKEEFDIEKWMAYQGALPVKECLEHPDESVFSNFVIVPEILRLYDLNFVSLENLGLALDFAMLMNECVDASDDFFISKDLCTVHRMLIGALVLGYMPRLKAFMQVGMCHCGDKTVKFFCDIAGSEFLFIDIPTMVRPYNDFKTPAMFDYMCFQVEDVMKKLEAITGRRPSAAKIKEVFELSNQAYEIYEKIKELRKHKPTVITAIPAWSSFLLCQNHVGTKRAIEFLNITYRELKKIIETGNFPVQPEHYRVLYQHIEPFWWPGFSKWLADKYHAAIVFEEVADVRNPWEPLDPARPVESLADAIMRSNIHFMATEDQRAAYAADKCKEYGAEIVIHGSQLGCQWTHGALSVEKKRLNDRGISFFAYDNDNFDSRSFNWKQIEDRFDAFFASLPKKAVRRQEKK